MRLFGEGGSKEKIKGQCMERLKLKKGVEDPKFLDDSPKSIMSLYTSAFILNRCCVSMMVRDGLRKMDDEDNEIANRKVAMAKSTESGRRCIPFLMKDRTPEGARCLSTKRVRLFVQVW
jgi:hypothetical protein